MRTRGKGEERRRAFEEMTVPHLEALYRFAVQKVRDAHQAEDLVQEACLKAYRAFERFEQGTDYKAWLFRILINTILDFQRKASREPIEVSLETDNFLFNHHVEAERNPLLDPERQLMAGSLAQVVQAAIDQLPPEWQAVVLLNFVEGFSYKKIAHILGCPIGTVMSRLYRARQFLRQRLERYLDREGYADPKRSPGQGASVTPLDLIRHRIKTRFKKKEG
ncbi:MAG: sigma-70 family RNA polymerase sigma factor [candidate division NC10 bacterium]|nr:sigma-70 family RNA polymerase sigma factor [candidate division NC10 bacterium]